MTVHFICRGNVFRSQIAEAYLNSLHLPDIHAISSGVVADAHRDMNRGYLVRTNALLRDHGLGAYTHTLATQLTPQRVTEDQLVICMNQRAAAEAGALTHLPGSFRVWDIDDIGEGKRLLAAGQTRDEFEADTYQEITHHVDELVKELQES